MTLRIVARGVVFLQRMRYDIFFANLGRFFLIYFVGWGRRASEIWRAQCAPKPAIKAALEDVRRRRQQRTKLLH